MGIRPGDSAPRFDAIEADEAFETKPPSPPLSFGAESSLEDDDDLPPGMPRFGLPGYDDNALSDSQILGGKVMVPHYSDGSTDILKRGWDQQHESAEEESFPNLEASPEASPDALNETQCVESTPIAPPSATDDATLLPTDTASTHPESPVCQLPDHDDTSPDERGVGELATHESAIVDQNIESTNDAIPSFLNHDANHHNADHHNADHADVADFPAFHSADVPQETPLANDDLSLDLTSSVFTASPSNLKSPSTSQQPPKKSNLTLVLILSCVSALTLGFGFLKWRQSGIESMSSQLESLPDPNDLDNSMQFYPRDVPLPAGQIFTIGESRRVGDIQVEVLRVTRQPITYQHYSGDTRQKFDNSPPVLQLWLKLTNLSDVDIAPLDYNLVFKQRMNAQNELMSNTFVSEQGKQASGPIHLMFDRAEDPLFDMVGMHLGKVLKPGESLETFLPSTSEAVTELDAGHLVGTLAWRVHLRKGYTSDQKGSTTLIEVHFPTGKIEVVTPPPPVAPQKPSPNGGAKKKSPSP